jgi:hypothetical protein
MFLYDLLSRHPRVIISRRNSGFGDNLLAAANAWYYAKQTNRTLAIVWQPSRYLQDQRENAFNYFFTLPDTIEGVPIIIEPGIDSLSIFIISHPFYYLPAPDPLLLVYKLMSKLGGFGMRMFKERIYERQDALDAQINGSIDVRRKLIITHGCYGPNDRLKPFFDSLRLQSEFQREVDAFAEKQFKNKKVIGVHVRYYSKYMPESGHTRYWRDQAAALGACIDKIKKAAAGFKGSEYVVFLSTDSRTVHDFVSRTVDNVVSYDKDFPSDSSRELHEELPVETASASVIEMFLLAKSDVLVRFPPGSWFSNYASLYAGEVII